MRRAVWDGAEMMALWYPQMGGYAAKAVTVLLASDSCHDLYVWHDGDFPFSGDEDRAPIQLHHCDPEQFRLLAEQLGTFSAALEAEGK